jgi:uncharacterized protein (DUF1015 family)
VDGREGATGVKGLIDHGDAAVGFLVSRVPTEDIMRVADAGQLLPAKVRSDLMHLLSHLCIVSARAFSVLNVCARGCPPQYAVSSHVILLLSPQQATFFDPKPMSNMLLRLTR